MCCSGGALSRDGGGPKFDDALAEPSSCSNVGDGLVGVYTLDV